MAETTTLITKLSEAEIESLETLYTLRGREEILSFIEQNFFLVPLLLEAPDKIKEYFGKVPLVLEVVADVEVIGDIRLLIYIITELEPEAAVDKLSEFDFGWWLDASVPNQEKLEIDVDFP